MIFHLNIPGNLNISKRGLEKQSHIMHAQHPPQTLK